MIALIVTIGLLNICLGFGLAMYFGYGPPGLDGIFEAIGPMPPVAADSKVEPGMELTAMSNHAYPPTMQARRPMVPGESMPSANGGMPPAELLAEEKVLGDVRDLTATAQTAMLSGQVESHE